MLPHRLTRQVVISGDLIGYRRLGGSPELRGSWRGLRARA